MKTLSQFAIRLTALAIVVSLGGCLSKETAATSAAPDPGGTSNRAPTISGVPNSSVLMGEQYSFSPTATDADNDPLSFNIQGAPNWLRIDANSGAVTGSPLLGDVGTYSGILVSVSDGTLSASLPQFSVAVVQNANGSVTLTWTAPTLNEDGTALTDLAGYKIHYGTSSGSYSVQIPVDLGTTMLMVDNLVPDTYYFAATAINSSNIESRYSGEAIKVVN